VIVALPDFPERAAVITAVPALTPVTSPAAETVATALLLDVQVTTRSANVRPRQSRKVADAVVVSPTAIELCANDTDTDAIRFASADRSSVLRPSVPVKLSLEQENMPNMAREMPTPLFSVRFMVPLMNRATDHSQAARYAAQRRGARYSRTHRRMFATSNAYWTARIYIRQAKRSFRHCVLR
jgi:hypothetical protein